MNRWKLCITSSQLYSVLQSILGDACWVNPILCLVMGHLEDETRQNKLPPPHRKSVRGLIVICCFLPLLSLWKESFCFALEAGTWRSQWEDGQALTGRTVGLSWSKLGIRHIIGGVSESYEPLKGGSWAVIKKPWFHICVSYLGRGKWNIQAPQSPEL